ncbi:MAG: hypothetical protein J7K04_01430 [Spirochaetales bacterium]|nr:hypothetical protein [Spirochaetales bacterium]
MKKTMFRNLVDQIKALAPLCNFEMPETLCNDKELFIRRRYAQLNKEIESLINLATSA